MFKFFGWILPLVLMVGVVWAGSDPMNSGKYIQSGDDMVGENHPTKSDTLNRAVKAVVSRLGVEHDMDDDQAPHQNLDAAAITTGMLGLDRLPSTLTGKDADMLDGQDGSYYQNSDNLNAGTVPLARIPSTLTGKDADTWDGYHLTKSALITVTVTITSGNITGYAAAGTLIDGRIVGVEMYDIALGAGGDASRTVLVALGGNGYTFDSYSWKTVTAGGAAVSLGTLQRLYISAGTSGTVSTDSVYTIRFYAYYMPT